jgi:hypothetical protein
MERSALRRGHKKCRIAEFLPLCNHGETVRGRGVNAFLRQTIQRLGLESLFIAGILCYLQAAA